MPSVAEVAVFPSGIDSPGDLRAANMPFIDGSHHAFEGADTPYLSRELFPRAGGAVHPHDIILPYEYLPLFRQRRRNGQYDGGDGRG